MESLDLISIGEVSAPHGVQGLLRVTMLTDFPDRWRTLKQVYLTPPPGGRGAAVPRLYPLVQTRILGGARGTRRLRIADPEDARTGPWGGQVHQILLKLGGVDDRDAADALRGYSVQIPRAEAWPLPPGTFYTFQILNLPVITTGDAPVGTVTDVIATGSNDVYVVRTPDGGELLVPAIKDIVTEINPAAGYVRVEDPAAWAPEDEPPPAPRKGR
jgi:16S rRNA processing protein RimM